MSKIRKGKRAAPKRRNIIHRHAKLKSGAGVHKTKRRQDVVTDADWAAADYAQYGGSTETKEKDMRISLSDFRAEHGINSGTDMVDALAEWSSDSVVPALCSEGCEVEPDGQCEHGCPSILVRMGVI